MERLEYFNLFHSTSKADLDMITSKLQPRKFKKGESLVVPGEIQKDLYFVKSGVQMSYVDIKSKTHVIAFTYSPHLCAIPESFLFQAPSKYFLTCLTDSEVDCISFTDLQTLFDQSQNLERLFRIMAEALLAGVINRHVELQALSMEDRYKTFCQRSPHLLQLVPHKFIASYLGINATNFSKLYNKVKF
jgi:CRP-like cAMP-binding protein